MPDTDIELNLFVLVTSPELNIFNLLN